MADKLGKYRRMRHLKQYADMSDEEFDSIIVNKKSLSDYEEKVEAKLREFAEDYDLSDLKINDKAALRALIQALIDLEEYQQEIYKLRQQGLNESNITIIDRTQKLMSELRSDISKLQDDLKITRKTRKSEAEQNFLSYMNSLHEKAKKFYESKSFIILCPKCKMMVGTVWVQYPLVYNKFTFTCNRDLGDKTKCNTKFSVYSKDLYENRGTNEIEYVPESLA